MVVVEPIIFYYLISRKNENVSINFITLRQLNKRQDESIKIHVALRQSAHSSNLKYKNGNPFVSQSDALIES